MKAVEAENDELKGILRRPTPGSKIPRWFRYSKTFSQIELDAEGDAFGRIYEYFLGNFARAEGQKGGEFFTPISLVKLIVQIIEPYHGRIYDPACGSGGMFVQVAVRSKPTRTIPVLRSPYTGKKKVDETRQLCLMNLAVHRVVGGYQTGQQLLRRPAQQPGTVRFRDGQSRRSTSTRWTRIN